MTNPFSTQIAAAKSREDKLRQQEATTSEQQETLRQERLRQAAEQQLVQEKIQAIRAKIDYFIRGFVAAVSSEFSKNPRKPWNALRIEQAGDYVAFLIQDYVSGTVTTAPEISPQDAQLIRDKFVWGIVMDAEHPYKGVTLPAGALVGQHADWFPGLFEKKQVERAKYLARKQAERDQANTAGSSTDTVDEVNAPDATAKPDSGLATVTCITNVAAAITPKGTRGGRPQGLKKVTVGSLPNNATEAG